MRWPALWPTMLAGCWAWTLPGCCLFLPGLDWTPNWPTLRRGVASSVRKTTTAAALGSSWHSRPSGTSRQPAQISLIFRDRQESVRCNRAGAKPKAVVPFSALSGCCAATGSTALPVLDEQSLARDQNWQRSRFGELEAFMVDFLVGGTSAGESLRLKLQTPLFVSDALLEAARTQLAAELATAEQVHCGLPLKLCFWLPACIACHLQIAIMECLVRQLPQDCTATESCGSCMCRMQLRCGRCRNS